MDIYHRIGSGSDQYCRCKPDTPKDDEQVSLSTCHLFMLFTDKVNIDNFFAPYGRLFSKCYILPIFPASCDKVRF